MPRGTSEKGQLVYTKIGNGPKALFAFHGFGQDKTFFNLWERELGSIFTIFSFDIFYHGESNRPYKNLSKNVWANYLAEIIEENQIENFSLLGYSLGGRFAIAAALSFPNKINEIILIAPDGIFLTIWFKLATTPVVKLIFKYMMLNPDKLEKWIRFNEKTRIVSKYVADFVRKELGTSENRKRVYISWNYFKSLGYKRSTLIAEFRKYSFKRRIILGSKDHIIRPKDILPIIEEMGEFEVNVLDKKHHQLLDTEVAHLLI